MAGIPQSDERKVVSFGDSAIGDHGVGAELRMARIRAGYELETISDGLRIRCQHLQAIEDGNFDDLPGPAYAVGFVRSYASFLGLDPDDLVQRFKDEVAGFPAQQDLRFPEPAPEGRLPRGVVVVVSLILAGGVYLAWNEISSDRTGGESIVAEVPDRLAETLEEPAVPSVSSSPNATPPASDGDIRQSIVGVGSDEQIEGAAGDAPSEPEPRAADPDGDIPLLQTQRPGEALAADAGADAAGTSAESRITGQGGTDEAAERPAIVAVAPPATQSVERDGAADEAVAGRSATAAGGGAGGRESETAAADTTVRQPIIPSAPATGEYVPRVYGQGNTNARVVLRARSDSWVQVQGADDELLLTRILRAGDTYLVPNRSDLTLITGNAGGLEVIVDGEALPPLGEPGSVVRDVPLDPSRLRAEAGRG